VNVIGVVPLHVPFVVDNWLPTWASPVTTGGPVLAGPVAVVHAAVAVLTVVWFE
jgi:hypothetical protein